MQAENRRIIRYLKRTRKAFSSADITVLKKLANEAIKYAALTNDKRVAELSVVCYSLMKISSKHHIVESSGWPAARKRIILQLRSAEDALPGEKDDFEKELGKIQASVLAVDEKLGHFVMNSIRKSRLKLASSAYALGMSLGAASELTKADKKEVMAYIGGTTIHDEEASELSIAQRIRRFRELLGK
jgi:hypothetical protein